ncbi:MAG: sigma 54-interacting transcriptional regulator [Myxococcota bacterium]
MRDVVVLSYRGEPLREFVIDDRPLEIGRGSFCDIVVHDPDVPERAFRLVRHQGTPAIQRGSEEPRVLPLAEPLPIGVHHSLLRVRCEMPTSGERTEPLPAPAPEEVRLSILVGRGTDARRVTLDRALMVGSDPNGDLVLADRAASRRHCRIEPIPGGALVRDLGSRNGTWIEGRRVMNLEVGPGTIVRVGRTNLYLVPRGRQGDARDTMIAVSTPMLSVLGEIERFARLKWPVLVQGESGVGKEGVARALHHRSGRSEGAFVALNAGGLAIGVIESELFGHEKGSFTGAAGTRRGVFEQAHEGTLFLDEIGELPMEMQARLLRVLETWEVRRVGAESAFRVDVRLVCATHRDLRKLVDEGRFREDLFYRIHRIPICIPPLRHRLDDIQPLAEHFLREAAPEVGVREIDAKAYGLLLGYDWPGNVRELRNVVTVAAALSPSRRISPAEIEEALGRASGVSRTPELERLEAVVAHFDGNITAAARALGMARSTLRDRLKKGKAA